MSEMQPTRREVLKKAVYVAPVILTLPAVASFAASGSRWHRDDNDGHRWWDKWRNGRHGQG
jgi:hypothetical protein